MNDWPTDWPTALDIAGAQIEALGYTIIGSSAQKKPGEIIRVVGIFDEASRKYYDAHNHQLVSASIEEHPFVVVAAATEAEIQAAADVASHRFNLLPTERPPAAYWYKCVTD